MKAIKPSKRAYQLKHMRPTGVSITVCGVKILVKISKAAF